MSAPLLAAETLFTSPPTGLLPIQAAILPEPRGRAFLIAITGTADFAVGWRGLVRKALPAIGRLLLISFSLIKTLFFI